MNKYLLFVLVSLTLPTMTLAGDQGKPSKMGQSHASTPRGFALHNIGTGDGITAKHTHPTTRNLGDTATHEVGHYRKRIDKSSPLLRSAGQSSGIMQDYYPHSNLSHRRSMAHRDNRGQIRTGGRTSK